MAYEEFAIFLREKEAALLLWCKGTMRVFIASLLVWHQGLGIYRDLFYLRDVVLLVRPDLEGIGVLLVHYPYALEASRFQLERGKLFLESSMQLAAVIFLAGTLKIVHVGANYEH